MNESVILGGQVRAKDPERARLAADVAAFEAAGGQVEVLGETPMPRDYEWPQRPPTGQRRQNNSGLFQIAKGSAERAAASGYKGGEQ